MEETERARKQRHTHNDVEHFINAAQLFMLGIRVKIGSFPVPPFEFSFQKLIQRCHKAMKFGVVNKSTILNRFVPHSLQPNIMHLAVITRKTNIKLGILKGGELQKSLKSFPFKAIKIYSLTLIFY